jgi:hypothetical protein
LTEQKSRAQLKKALDKSLELLDEPSKRTLLFYLHREYGISFGEDENPRIEEIEAALRSILGRGAYIITEEFHKNLERQNATSSARRPIANRQGKSLA